MSEHPLFCSRVPQGRVSGLARKGGLCAAACAPVVPAAAVPWHGAAGAAMAWLSLAQLGSAEGWAGGDRGCNSGKGCCGVEQAGRQSRT